MNVRFAEQAAKNGIAGQVKYPADIYIIQQPTAQKYD